MREQIENAKRYAVRLKSGNEILGSGVLWKPEGCQQNKLYIFTVAHVVKGKKNINVEFEVNGKIEDVPVEMDKIIIPDEYQKEGDLPDIGIIILDHEYNNFPWYSVAKWEVDKSHIVKQPDMILVGFPFEGMMEKSFEISKDTLECKYESVDEKKWIVKYKFQQANIDNSEKNSELVGFSGSGIFAVIDSELVLVGIHHGSLGQNVARGNLIGTTSDFIRKICEENNCVVPQRERRVNGNLSDRISFFEEEILTELRNDDYDKVMEVLQNILSDDVTEVINSTFCDYCEECKHHKNYHCCEFFRGFLLVLIIFLKTMDENVNLSLPRVKEMNDIPIYFICSEGKVRTNRDNQTKLKLNHFIYALKTKKDLSYKLENDCVIIWGPERDTKDTHRTCSASAYKNVLRDISRADVNRLDITGVAYDFKPKCIIHVNEVIKMMCEGNLKQLKSKFIKYIEELGK